jgi:Ca-activated chloride channel family protein
MSKTNLSASGTSLVAFTFLLGCTLLLFPSLRAFSQSMDDVHVVPHEHTASQAPPLSDSADSRTVIHPSTRRFRVDVDLVLIPVTVTDNKNRMVTSLQKENFLLSEAGEPQHIQYFSAEDAPISVGVLLDLSRSMTNKIDTAREALGEFFKNANPEDDYFVLTFANRPELLAGTTQSIENIQSKLALAVPSGNTALLDAIYVGISRLRNARYKRRALLIISDGGDNHSRYDAKEIRKLVQEADVEIYAIGIFDSIFKTYEEWTGKRLLTEISEETGGRTATVEDLGKLPEIAATISRELRNQYVLGYRPKNSGRDGQLRKIKVQLTRSLNDTPLQIYYRRGYHGPEE